MTEKERKMLYDTQLTPETPLCAKLLKDCMTAVGFWKDDAQVASEICEKFWAEVPGIYVCAEEIK